MYSDILRDSGSPPEGLMKKYNLAKRKGGISKGSLRPQKRAQREGMDRLRRQGTRISGKTEITSVCVCVYLRIQSQMFITPLYLAVLIKHAQCVTNICSKIFTCSLKT